MALAGIQVLEIAGLAPTPFLGMILADFGAKVIRVDKIQSFTPDTMARGKRSISLNLKKNEAKVILKRLSKQSDVLVEPFRPGTMEKLGLGPEVMQTENPGLVYVRLSGFGQTGPYKSKAGHDINYVATSGVLSKLRQQNHKPVPPVNLVADFAGGGLLAAFGVLAALLERNRSGNGQVVDMSMVDGSAYLSSFLFTALQQIFPNPPGSNLLDGGAPFYDTYKTKDGKYVAVGAIEPQFYQKFINGLNLDDDELFSQQMNSKLWPDMKKKLSEVFSSYNLDELSHLFDDDNTCVMPVLTPEEAFNDPHNKYNRLFFEDPKGQYIPNPAPKLSRTPASADQGSQPMIGGHTREVLLENGFSFAEIDHFLSIGAAADNSTKSRL